MKKVLNLFAHPGQRHSTVNVKLADAVKTIDQITHVDLYARYPRFNIDIDAEQQALLEHDIIVLQFPVFWYSMPSLLKEWLDLVLEFGFAYGAQGNKLAGKWMLPVLTAGGMQDTYQTSGSNRHTIRELFSPLEQTAHLCQMTYIPPMVLFGSLGAKTEDRLEPHIKQYRDVMLALRDDRFDLQQALKRDLLLDESPPILEGA
jgi:putative NADPH-quinone reductase